MKRLKKFWRIARPWVLFLALIATCIFIVLTSKGFQSCVAEQPQQTQPKDFVEGVSDLFWVVRGCSGVFVHENGEAIIAAFTIILAGSTIALWDATRGLVGGAEEASNRQLRAYVFLDSAGIFDRGRPRKTRRTKAEKEMEGQIGGFMTIKNSGQTPAYKVIHFGLLAICRPEEEEAVLRIPKFDGFRAGGTLPPGGAMSKNLTRPEIVTPEEIAAVRAGTKLIYLYGRIEYLDILGKRRFTNYRLSFGGSYPPYGDILLIYRDSGNESDQNSD